MKLFLKIGLYSKFNLDKTVETIIAEKGEDKYIVKFSKSSKFVTLIENNKKRVITKKRLFQVGLYITKNLAIKQRPIWSGLSVENIIDHTLRTKKALKGLEKIKEKPNSEKLLDVTIIKNR